MGDERGGGLKAAFGCSKYQGVLILDAMPPWLPSERPFPTARGDSWRLLLPPPRMWSIDRLLGFAQPAIPIFRSFCNRDLPLLLVSR